MRGDRVSQDVIDSPISDVIALSGDWHPVALPALIPDEAEVAFGVMDGGEDIN